MWAEAEFVVPLERARAAPRILVRGLKIERAHHVATVRLLNQGKCDLGDAKRATKDNSLVK